ncbi:hypothetical protein HK18_01375 [Commensalibacter intestini]|uniref:Uncharacterized protein n=1 Tax=Commensalibacter intestini TaxID=479936 RepID=A0A251ZT34_9PROT|nr:hypothetical protein [Commensalibacter intestini]OUI77812.1 hypothetical protein HK18_01375 [Commensalibacter intestini]
MFTAQEMNNKAKFYLDNIYSQLHPVRFESSHRCHLWIASRVKTTVSTLENIKSEKIKFIPSHVYENLKELYVEFKNKSQVVS